MHSDTSNTAREVYSIHVAPEQSSRALVEEITRHTSGQKQPVLLILPARQVAAFRRPGDFLPFKHLKRQPGMAIFFVIPGSSTLRIWAERCGLVVYGSQEEYLSSTDQRLPTSVPSTVTEPGLPPRDTAVLRPVESSSQEHDLPVVAPSSENGQEQQQIGRDDLALSAASPGEPDTSIPPDRKLLLRSLTSQDTMPLMSVGILPNTPLPASPVASPFLKRPWVQLALAGLVVLCVIASVSTLFVLKRLQPQAKAVPAPFSPPLVGYVYFQSSGQFNQQGNEGLNDGLLIDLQHIAIPAPGKSYQAWLLSDTNVGEEKAIYLGQLQVAHGDVHSVYVDPRHINLLTLGSRFLVTEDDTGNIPGFPFDTSTWRYEGIIPQTPNLHDTMGHFSLLDHLRHLLASEPGLNSIGLKGGLDTWFYRDTAKLLEWTFSARDDWASGATAFIRRQITRTLDYLDGFNEVPVDVPPGTPFLGDTAGNRVGLLELEAGRGPTPGLIYEMDRHLVGLDASQGRSMEQHTLTLQILDALNRTQYWLQQARQDARQLLGMDDTQLLSQQAHGLLNDLATDANNAYVGTTDPATGNVQPCALWAVTTMQRLASIPIRLYSA